MPSAIQLSAAFLEVWRLYDLTRVANAAGLLHCSTSKIYSLHEQGKLEVVRTGNLSFVRTAGLVRLIDEAPPLGAENGDARSHFAHAQRRKRTARGTYAPDRQQPSENDNQNVTVTAD